MVTTVESLVTRRGQQPWLRARLRGGAWALLVALAMPAGLTAAERRVPAEYPTIQAAINAALAGDQITVAAGTYNESLSFGGKSLRLIGEAGPAATILRGTGGATVRLGPSGWIEGFTITAGAATFGAGMEVSGTGNRITGNIFEDNAQGSGGFGAGIGGNSASAVIDRNIFRNNSCDAQSLSGVIAFVNSSVVTIANNVFLNNPCRAINMTLPVSGLPLVVNNTIIGNRVGIRVDRRIESEQQIYRNNIIVGNGVGLEAEFGLEAYNPTWENNLVHGNGINYRTILDQTGTAGNVSADPLFRDVDGADFRLLAGSPAIDSGTSAGAPAVDFNDGPRPVDGDRDGVARFDLGAYEFRGEAVDDVFYTPLATAADIDVLENDSGFVDPVTLTIVAGPTRGDAGVTGSPGDQAGVRITYAPEAGFAGADAITYQVSDGTSTDIATARILVGPQATDDHVDAFSGVLVAVDVLANDRGFASPVTVALVTPPAEGTAQVVGSPGEPGSIRVNYRSAPGYTGADSLVYSVTDGTSTDTAVVQLQVGAAAIDDTYIVQRDACCQTLRVALNDQGFSTPVTLTLLSGPDQGGTAFVGTSQGSTGDVYVYYSPNPGGRSQDYVETLRYRLTDGVRSDTASIRIEVVRFRAINDLATTGSGRPVTIDVAGNDIGFGGSRLIGLFTAPQNGTAEVVGGYAGGSIRYTPAPGFVGTDEFQYAIEDGLRAAIAKVTVSVIVDADGDLVADTTDNCVVVANPGQGDADGDGYGNACDADLNNDGRTNFADLAIFRLRFATTDPAADFNEDGVVNFADLARFRQLFGQVPGPSASGGP